MRIKGLSIGHCLGAATLSLLAACGGADNAAPGGGNGNQAVALSAQNEPTLSAAAVREFAGAQGLASLGAGATTGQLGIASLPVRRAFAATRQAGRVTPQAEVSDNPCSGGGKVVIETGDDLLSFKSTFNACVEENTTLNGSINVALVSVSDDGLLQTFDATLTTLSVAVGTTTATLNGSLRMTLDTATAGQTKTSLTGTQLSFELSTAGQVQVTSTLNDAQFTDIRSEAGQLTDTFSFSSSSSLTPLGKVAYKAETVTALVTPPEAKDPASGQIKVTVNGKGIILLTAEATRVRVQADVEGDGVFEVDRFDTWSNLSGGL